MGESTVHRIGLEVLTSRFTSFKSMKNSPLRTKNWSVSRTILFRFLPLSIAVLVLCVNTLLSLKDSTIPRIDSAVYINLRERSDRSARIVGVLNAAGITAKRIEAFKFENRPQPGVTECWGNTYCASQIACQLSHLRALKFALLNEVESVAVFEDDFAWSSDVEPTRVLPIVEEIQRTYKSWDVIALSLNILSSVPAHPRRTVELSQSKVARVVRITSAQATHGYLVRRRYIENIYNAFKSCDMLSDPLVAIDSCWKPLQSTGHWYGVIPQLGTQIPGYSDIESKNVTYNIQANIRNSYFW